MRFLSSLLVVLLAAATSSAQVGAPSQRDGDGFLLDDAEIEELMRIEDGGVPAGAQSASSNANASAQRWRLVLRDGQVLHGKLVSQTRDDVVLEVAPGAHMTLARSAIRDMQVEREQAAGTARGATTAEATTAAKVSTASASAPRVDAQQAPAPSEPPPPSDSKEWFSDPNRSRGMYVPTAMMLRKGEGSISQKELFFTSFGYGLTDWLSVQVGGVVPTWFVDGGFNLIGGVKLGGKVLEGVHLSAGAQSLVVAPDGNFGAIGFAYGNATFGNANFHATLTVGIPWMAVQDVQDVPFAQIGDFIVVASGNLRLTENVALVTENWVFPTAFSYDEGLTHIIGLAVRLMNQNLSADIGFLAFPGVPLPIPWLSGTWNFKL